MMNENIGASYSHIRWVFLKVCGCFLERQGELRYQTGCSLFHENSGLWALRSTGLSRHPASGRYLPLPTKQASAPRVVCDRAIDTDIIGESCRIFRFMDRKSRKMSA